MLSRLPSAAWYAFVAVVLIGQLAAQSGPAAQTTEDAGRRHGPLDFMPADAAVVLEVAAPVHALEQLHAALGDLPPDLPAETGALLAAGLLATRVFLGGGPQDFASRVAEGGVALALVADGANWRTVAAVRPGDAAAASQWLHEHGQGVVHRRQDAFLLLASNPAALATIAARAPQAAEPWWQASLAACPEHSLLRAAIDLAALRRFDAQSRGLFATLDGVGRFVLGPLAGAIDRASRARLSLGTGDGLRLQLHVDATVLGQPLDGLLPAAGGRYASVDVGADTLLSLCLDRSVHRLLAAPARYLPAAAVTEIDSFLSIADGFDGPSTSIVDDLFGRLGEPATLLVLSPAQVPDAERAPLLLPDLAVVVPIADAKVELLVRRVVNLFAVIANAERAQRRQGSVQLRGWRGEHGQGLVAEMPEWRGPGAPPIETSLSPAVLFGNGHMVLASTSAAAERVLAACANGRTLQVTGDRLRLFGPAIAAVLAGSRQALVLARMLDEGEDLTAANRFFAIVDAVLRCLGELRLDVQPDAAGTTVTMEVVRQR